MMTIVPLLLAFAAVALAAHKQVRLQPVPSKLTGILPDRKVRHGTRRSLNLQPLVFDKDGTFKIVSFSDLHYGERLGNYKYGASVAAIDADFGAAPFGPANDKQTDRVQATILDYEKPDFVVYNGDLVTGENLLKKNATKYLDQVDR